MFSLTCPKCNHKFFAVEDEGGECPECNNGYTFVEQGIGDFSVTVVLWDWKNENCLRCKVD